MKGKFILIRMPIRKEFLILENVFLPNFNVIIKRNFPKVTFLDYSQTGSKFLFPDGNHLYYKSGEKFTKILADDIDNLE